MSRNQHHRERDHFGQDLDTYVVTSEQVGGFAQGTTLNDVMHNVTKTALAVVLDGVGAPVLSGNRGWVEVPFAAHITGAKLLADQAGNITVDIWKTDYAGFPPDASDSICASAKLALGGAQAYTSPLTGWTTAVSAGDILWFHVDSNDLVSTLTISLTLARG